MRLGGLVCSICKSKHLLYKHLDSPRQRFPLLLRSLSFSSFEIFQSRLSTRWKDDSIPDSHGRWSDPPPCLRPRNTGDIGRLFVVRIRRSKGWLTGIWPDSLHWICEDSSRSLEFSLFLFGLIARSERLLECSLRFKYSRLQRGHCSACSYGCFAVGLLLSEIVRRFCLWKNFLLDKNIPSLYKNLRALCSILFKVFCKYS